MVSLRGSHRPRVIAHLGLREVGDWRLKVYGIAATGPRPRLVEAALSTAERALPASSGRGTDGEPDHYGVGFCVVHDAADRCFVLADWWAAENELHQRMYSAPLDEPEALTPHSSPAIGCVWELAVTDFERRAWLSEVLANPGGPDLDAYLHATFNETV
jgi:hypothetical protein